MAAVVEPTVDNGIRTEALALVEQAKGLTISNSQQYEDACLFGRELAGRIKRVEVYFEELIEPARRTWKTLCAKRDEVLTPLESAKKHIATVTANWQIEERKRAEAEAEKLRLQAIREEEDRRLAQAEALQAEGRKEEAEQVLCEETIPVPVVANVSENVPKVQGTSKARVRYKGRVTNLGLLIKAAAEGKVPHTLLMADLSAINRYVEACKGQTVIPGVEVYSEAGVSFRS